MSPDVRNGWIGFLGPPVVWAAQFQARYAVAGRAAGPGHPLAQVIVGAVALAVIVACGFLARPTATMAADSTAAFLSRLGRWSAAAFALATIAQLLPLPFISPWAK